VPPYLPAYLVPVKLFLMWLYDTGQILANVAMRVEIPRCRQPLPPKPLSIEEVDRLIALVPPTSLAGMRGRAMLELMYGCGLRRSELVGLNVGDVAFSKRTVSVRGKGGKDRVVPVNDIALDAVSKYLHARRRPALTSPL